MRECGKTFEQIEEMTLAEIACLLSSADGKKQTSEEMQAAALDWVSTSPFERLARARRG